MNKDQIWNIVLIISIILIIHGMAKVGDLDKKTAEAAQGETAIGITGTVVYFIGKKGVAQGIFAVIPGWGWAAAVIVTLAMFVPGIIKNIISIFKPTPTIPSWVWIAGFILLFVMISSRKK